MPDHRSSLALNWRRSPTSVFFLSLRISVRVAMAMAMMEIGVVRVSMEERRMSVPMSMRLPERHIGAVLVLMMLVVGMSVFVLQLVMGVLVVMPLGQVQP